MCTVTNKFKLSKSPPQPKLVVSRSPGSPDPSQPARPPVPEPRTPSAAPCPAIGARGRAAQPLGAAGEPAAIGSRRLPPYRTRIASRGLLRLPVRFPVRQWQRRGQGPPDRRQRPERGRAGGRAEGGPRAGRGLGAEPGVGAWLSRAGGVACVLQCGQTRGGKKAGCGGGVAYP